MTAMFVNFVLTICLTGSLGHMVRKKFGPDIPPLLFREADPGSPSQQNYQGPRSSPIPWWDHKHEHPAPQRQEVDQGNPPKQWQHLVAFVYRKIESMERLLTKKDERIDNLELKIASQATEIKHVKQEMTSLKEEISEKNQIVGILMARVSDLEGMVMSDAVTSDRETVRYQRTENETQPDPVKMSDSTSRSSVKKTLTPKSSLPKTQKYQNGSVVYHPDKSDVDEYAVYTDDGSEDLAIAKHSRIKEKRVTPRTAIAFHVALSDGLFVTNDDTVVYDRETLDQGDGYNPREGVYTVPESGTYVLTWTTLCNRHEAIATLLEVNGAVRGVSWTDSEEINDNHQTTAVVVLTLNQGDHVFIRTGHTYGHGAIVSSSDLYDGVSTFSGWKLD